MVRVLITTSTFPMRLDDGVPRFVYDLAHALTEHAEVLVVAPDIPGEAVEECPKSFDVHRFRYFFPRAAQRLTSADGRGMRDNIRASWLAKLQVPCFFARQTSTLRKAIRRHRIDVVNAHWLVPQGLTAAWALRGIDSVKLVVHIHAGDVYLLRRLPFGRRIARRVVSRADAIFADGSHVRDTLDDLLGEPSGAVLQPMGVHCDRFGQTTSDEALPTRFPNGFVLFVGRLVEKKGLIYLIRAMQRVRQSAPGVGLVIVGSGPERERLEKEVAALDLHEAVEFVGRKPHTEIVRYLHQCRVAAVPSIIDSRGETEGMPTVVIEAMAAGVPVVGSDVAGIPDVIRHTENGWLCQPEDADDLAEKLGMSLDCRDQRLSDAAVETAARHDWRQVAANYLSCFERLSGRLATGAT